MSRWAQLYWPVDMKLPAGVAAFDQKPDGLREEWETVYDNLSELYGDAAPTLVGDSLARWLSAIYYRTALSSDEVGELGMEPLMTVAVWDNIEDDGEFPEGPDWWAPPGEVERACEGLIKLVEADNETALKALEIYVRGSLPVDDPRLGDEIWRKERKVDFLTELRRITENAANCREQGITKVGFLIYM